MGCAYPANVTSARTTPDQALCVLRIRQWCNDRALLASGRTTDYQRQGWRARRAAENDARLVRVIDFEKALCCITEEEQLVLIATYRNCDTAQQAAVACHCSERKIAYLLPQARRHLADVLDRLDLL